MALAAMKASERIIAAKAAPAGLTDYLTKISEAKEEEGFTSLGMFALSSAFKINEQNKLIPFVKTDL